MPANFKTSSAWQFMLPGSAGGQWRLAIFGLLFLVLYHVINSSANGRQTSEQINRLCCAWPWKNAMLNPGRPGPARNRRAHEIAGVSDI